MNTRIPVRTVSHLDADAALTFKWRGQAKTEAEAKIKARIAAEAAFSAMLRGAHAEAPFPEVLFTAVRHGGAGTAKDDKGVAASWNIGSKLEAAVKAATPKEDPVPLSEHEDDIDALTPYLTPSDGKTFWGVDRHFQGAFGVALKMTCHAQEGGAAKPVAPHAATADAILAMAAAKWAFFEFHMSNTRLLSGKADQAPQSATMRIARQLTLREERPQTTLRARLWLASISREDLAEAILAD